VDGVADRYRGRVKLCADLISLLIWICPQVSVTPPMKFLVVLAGEYQAVPALPAVSPLAVPCSHLYIPPLTKERVFGYWLVWPHRESSCSGQVIEKILIHFWSCKSVGPFR
jgi:hypothetical protein